MNAYIRTTDASASLDERQAGTNPATQIRTDAVVALLFRHDPDGGSRRAKNEKAKCQTEISILRYRPESATLSVRGCTWQQADYRLHRVPHRFSPSTLQPRCLAFTDGSPNFHKRYSPDFVPTVGNRNRATSSCFPVNPSSSLRDTGEVSHRSRW